MNKHPFDIQDENDSIVAAIKRISAKLEKTPTQQEYKRERLTEEPSLEQITYRFGKWSKAIKKAGLKPNPFQTPPRRHKITKKQLSDEFIRVANELKCVPGKVQFRANACYSWRPYETNWGSWKQAVNYILDTYSQQFEFEAKTADRPRKKSKRKPLQFKCPLKYEPQNEYETIVLFCFLAEELGFDIENVQSEFPDATLVKDGTEISVEFEFLSSNYIQHCHPMPFSGLVICWRKDVEIENVEALSLEEYLRKRKA